MVALSEFGCISSCINDILLLLGVFGNTWE